ncbi:MAG: DUF1015 domain-containing protein [Candidatus Dadabacteria bacterium]|nr:DUF1015 domain-containing protein [Candidatus Dadabacteria bacterium]
MAEIEPFRGIRYNREAVGDLAKVIAPPYDVISPGQREELCAKSPFNAVRIELPEGEGAKRYENAKEIYSGWLRDGVLGRDHEPSIYPYYQNFEFEGRSYTRKGFIANLKVEDFDKKIVLPHEQTFRKHKEDRLALTIACDSNLSQIFCVYPDAAGEVEGDIDRNVGEPIVDVFSEEGIRNTLWRISDPKIIQRVKDTLSDISILIADGHHRYETSINFRDLKRKEHGNTSRTMPWDYVMTYLSRGEGEGLIINPTHRLAKNIGENLIDRLRGDFEVKKIPPGQSLDLGPDQICVVTRNPEETFRLTPKMTHEKEYENLAVIILHNRVFGGLIEEHRAEVQYSKFPEEVFTNVRNGQFEVGFLLPKLKSEDIFKVVLDGSKMPHKTTYFYPKILSGLVFNPLWK